MFNSLFYLRFWAVQFVNILSDSFLEGYNLCQFTGISYVMSMFFLVNKKYFCIGGADKEIDIHCSKLVINGDDDRSREKYAKVRDGPFGGVFPRHCDTISSADTFICQPSRQSFN